MDPKIEIVFARGPPAVVLGELEITTLGDPEELRAAVVLEERYPETDRLAGRTLVQAIRKCRTQRSTSNELMDQANWIP